MVSRKIKESSLASSQKLLYFFRKRIYIPLFLVPQRIPRSSDLRSKRSLSQNLDCK